MHTATHLLAGLLALAVPSVRAAVESGKTTLAIQSDKFTVNGQHTFLLGFSYYAALGAPREFLRKDLDDLQQHGFNWLRVWATWDGYDANISVFDANGNMREPFFGRLSWLVKECDQRSLIVDVTLARRESDSDDGESGLLPNAQAHRRAVEVLVRELAPYRNWYLDLANERDVRDARYVSPEELRSLRQLARRVDPGRLVTASFGGHDLSAKDVRVALETMGLDFLAPHRPREPDSPGQTAAHTEAVRTMMRELGLMGPIHYQEPFRRGYSRWEPGVEDFLADLRGARAGGAAGWCFHNGSQRNAPDEQPRRSFDLRASRLMDQLDPVELEFVRRAAQ